MTNIVMVTILWNGTSPPLSDLVETNDTVHCDELGATAIYHWVNFTVISIIGAIGKQLISLICEWCQQNDAHRCGRTN